MHPRIVGRLCQTPIYPKWAFRRNAPQQRRSRPAFTLIELLVVIAIIAILVGLLFPAFKAVQNQAKQTQAKNDLTQIVNAVNAYYTEYGKYPAGTDDIAIIPNNTLFDVLRNVTAGVPGNTSNPRGIIFISPPYVKNTALPRSGIQSLAGANNGNYYDPWGNQYQVAIDTGYDNQMTNPYTANTGAGPNPLQQGVIAWSLGLDQTQGTNFSASDDVVSWQ